MSPQSTAVVIVSWGAAISGGGHRQRPATIRPSSTPQHDFTQPR